MCQYRQSKNLFLTVSLDATAKIWCISTFTHHYTFQLMSGLNYVRIFDSGKTIVCGRNDSIVSLELHMILDKYMQDSTTNCK